MSNTFKRRYKKGEKYLHFFKEKKSMQEIKKIKNNDDKNYYYCTFDIPIHILLKGIGTGYYESSGYDVMYKELREFIINVKEFNPKWFIDAEFDVEKAERINSSVVFEK